MEGNKRMGCPRFSSRSFILIGNSVKFLFLCLLIIATICRVQAAPPGEVEQKLEEACSNLRTSQDTEARILSEIDDLKRSGKATPQMLKDYEMYLGSVRAMVAENQKIVRDMEEAYARHFHSEKTGGCSKSTPSQGTAPAAMATGEEAGELDTLDRKLNDSLSSFDQMLLKEMDDIRVRSEKRMQELAQEAASAAGRIGERGEGSGESGGEEAAAGESGKPASAEQGQEEQQKSGTSESGGSSGNVPVTDGPVEGASTAGTTGSGQRAQQPAVSAQDDDIVARQLREAAEKETDPELKKKLWKEYEDYKKASR